MKRILVIEDDEAVQRLIESLLLASVLITQASNLADARQSLRAHPYDLILLDVMLPDGDGMGFLAELRGLSETSSVPILMLTGRVETKNKVMAFSLGAEDYISKPFDPFELKARVESKLRQRDQKADLFLKGPLIFSLESQKVILRESGKAERELFLTPTEFKLLLYLAKHEGVVVSRSRLIDLVWGDSVHVSDRAVDTHISKLRKKLLNLTFEIRAVPGVGYTFQKLADPQLNVA